MTKGQNTVSSDELRGFVERVEAKRAEKRQSGDDEKAIMAEAAAKGFTPKAISQVVKIRAMKPNDRQESEALLDMYLAALGMAVDPPLFRFAGLAGIDITAREQVLDRMKDFVPANGLGEITVTWQGKSMRLTRDKDGHVNVAEVVAAPMEELPAKPKGATPKAPPPDVDDAGAEDLGRQYAKDNRPVIDNPFPFGDPRRAKFDAGWRQQTGSDGMGPDRED